MITYRGLCFLSLVLGLPASVRAETPLHERIDRAIAAAQPDFARRAAAPAADAEFLRRVYLDLTGTIPTAAEVRAFLNDRAPGKRQKLIDRLLASPEHARHLATLLDVMLMERRPDKHVPRAAWLDYLRSAAAANKHWDELVREILSSDGVDAKTRPTAKFYLEREAEPNLLTRDICGCRSRGIISERVYSFARCRGTQGSGGFSDVARPGAHSGAARRGLGVAGVGGISLQSLVRKRTCRRHINLSAASQSALPSGDWWYFAVVSLPFRGDDGFEECALG